MSEALERVIAQQQAEIDQWKKRDASSIEAWAREHKKREALASAVFSLLNFPDAPHSRTAVIEALSAWGYCLMCECSPCECEGEYD